MADWQDAVFYSTENVGAAFATPSGESKRAALYSVSNVGAGFTRPNNESKAANQYIFENVGVGWRKPDDASANANLYSEFNALDEVLADGPLWVEATNGEVMWEPGLIYNGCEFVRYSIWNGNCWQASSSIPETPILEKYPTAVAVYRDSDRSTSPISLPAFPGGMTSAIAIVATAAFTTINAPAGWTVLGETSVPNPPTGGTSHIRKCIAVAIDSPTGLESTTFTFSDPMADSYNGYAYACAYFTGGKTGGTWTATKGVETEASYANFTDIPLVESQPNLWWQAGIITAAYTLFAAPPGVSGDNNGFVTSWCYPTGASGSTFRSAYLDGLPYSSPEQIVDTNSIGAYGQPKSTTWGFKWMPPPDGAC